MPTGFQIQPTFRKPLGRHRSRFQPIGSHFARVFQQLTRAARQQNSRNYCRVGKVGLTGCGVDSDVATVAALFSDCEMVPDS